MSEGRSPLPRGSRWIRAICVPCLLVIAVLASMGQVALHRFGPVDDPANIWENPKLNPPRFDSEGVLSYWLRPELGLYIPVTYTVWGILAAATWSPTPDDDGAHVDPRAFHAASLLFHTLSVLAVYAILLRLTGRRWPSAAGALVFAIHPLQVEAVAWAAGLKDVLSGTFSLIALSLYVRAVKAEAGAENPSGEEPDANGAGRSSPADVRRFPPRLRPWFWHALGILSLQLALLSKPAAMIVPLVAATADRGFLRRPFKAIVRSSGPWFVAAIPLALVARLVQPGVGIPAPPLWQRPIVALASLSFYFGKVLAPVGLTFDYGWQPMAMLASAWVWGVALIPVVLAAVLWRFPCLASSGLVSVCALLPVLGFVPFLYQYYSTVADHYFYLGMLGPAIAVACVLARVPPRGLRWARAACVLGLVLLAGLTFAQMRHWRDEETMLRRMLQVNSRSFLAHNALGYVRERHGDLVSAEREYLASSLIDPYFVAPRENLASLYVRQARAEEAIAQYRALIEIRALFPHAVGTDYSGAFFEAGQISAAGGRYSDAILYFAEDLRIRPYHMAAREALERARKSLSDDRGSGASRGKGA